VYVGKVFGQTSNTSEVFKKTCLNLKDCPFFKENQADAKQLGKQFFLKK
jgi:hypothetical protein